MKRFLLLTFFLSLSFCCFAQTDFTCFRNGECFMDNSYSFYKLKNTDSRHEFWVKYYSGKIEFPTYVYVYPTQLDLKEELKSTSDGYLTSYFVYDAGSWFVGIEVDRSNDLVIFYVCSKTESKIRPGKYDGKYYVCRKN